MKPSFRIRTSVRTRLILSFLFFFLVPSLIISSYSYMTAREQVQVELQSSAKQNVQLLDSLVTSYIEPKIRELTDLASRIHKGMFAGQESPQVKSLLEHYQSLNPSLNYVYVGTETGDMIITPKVDLPPDFDPRKRPWYTAAMQSSDVVITEPYLDVATGNPIFTVAKVLDDHSGVVAVDMNLGYFAKIVKETKVGYKGYPFVIDKNKKIVVHPTIKPGETLSEAFIDNMYKSKNGTFAYEFKEIQKEMFFTTNEVTGWKLAGTMDASEADERAFPILKQTLIVILVVTVVGVVMGYFIIRSFIVPLRKLMNQTQVVAQGDLTHDISLHSRDEFGQLADSFNQMTVSLRELIREVNDKSASLAASSEELTASAEQSSQAAESIAVNIQQVAHGSEEQLKSVQQISQTIAEMASGVKQIAAHSQEVSQSAEQATGKTTEGSQAIHSAVQQMNAVNETVQELSRLVTGLGERSNEIGIIVDTITNISNQTNLLSLNAAIEAARAGEQGKGFAVVANEVRKLAEQSAQSAQQITDLIVSIQEETRLAVTSMDKGKQEVSSGIVAVHQAGEAFAAISESVIAVTALIQEVSASVQQLAAGAEQVVASIKAMEEVAGKGALGMQNISAATEQQLATMQEVASSTTVLSRMAEDLQDAVSRFKLHL